MRVLLVLFVVASVVDGETVGLGVFLVLFVVASVVDGETVGLRVLLVFLVVASVVPIDGVLFVGCTAKRYKFYTNQSYINDIILKSPLSHSVSWFSNEFIKQYNLHSSHKTAGTPYCLGIAISEYFFFNIDIEILR